MKYIQDESAGPIQYSESDDSEIQTDSSMERYDYENEVFREKE